MDSIKHFYLILRKNGKRSQEKLRQQIKFKSEGSPLYDAYEHGLAYGRAEAYMNVASWIKQCFKEEEK